MVRLQLKGVELIFVEMVPWRGEVRRLFRDLAGAPNASHGVWWSLSRCECCDAGVVKRTDGRVQDEDKRRSPQYLKMRLLAMRATSS